MRFLLDVNALIALGVVEHAFHARVTQWVRTVRSCANTTLLTCSITELGFVRVLSGTKAYGFTVSTASTFMVRIKTRDKGLFNFIADDQGGIKLPTWVLHPKQITDGHLVQLAEAHGGMLATLDRGIPRAFLIPDRVISTHSD